MRKYVTCGTLKVGVGFSDILCDLSTGDLIFCDDINGNCVMSNMSVTDPICTKDSPAVSNILASTGADGVIMSESYLIILRDGVAEYRDYVDATKIKHVVNYDLDIEYDHSIDYDYVD